jgi:hypothetical protein
LRFHRQLVMLNATRANRLRRGSRSVVGDFRERRVTQQELAWNADFVRA